MNTLTLNYHQDGGHGWVEISKKLAERIMGEDYHNISSYSYQKGDVLFLEEDCDAGLLVGAIKKLNMHLETNAIHHAGECVIRSYRRV